MALPASTLIAGAMGMGYAELSQRDCLKCLLYVYANGVSLQAMINGAQAMGFDALSDRDLDQCLVYALQ